MFITDFEKNISESNRLINKYPDRIPVIVGKTKGCVLNNIDKTRFLVPRELTIGQFITIIRKRIKLEPDKAIFIFINNILPPIGFRIGSVYEEMKHGDGFLYIYYNGESIFG
jgi:GABA(A) receptor-associated protein